MSDDRKPWEIPIIYTDDRFTPPAGDVESDADEGDEGRDANEIEQLLARPARPINERRVKSADDTPIDYSRGPHTEEFGVDESDVNDEVAVEEVAEAPDDLPVDIDDFDPNAGFDDDFD